jgi:hypothetical protein
MGKRALVIDVGAVSKYTAFSMLSGGEPVMLKHNIAHEAIRRFAKLVVGQHRMHRADLVIFAMDRKPYWRTEWLFAWYAEHASHLALKDGSFLLRYDNTVRRIVGQEETKLKVAELKNLPTEGWGKVPTDLLGWLPKYKGNRDGKSWPLADITPEDLDKSVEKAVRLLSARLNGKIVAKVGWEADDVAAVYCAGAPEIVDQVTLVTLDSDWRQLLSVDSRVKVSDIRLGQDFTQDHIPEQKAALRAKIVGGDRSDNLAGLPKGNSGCYGADTAAKLTKDGMPEGLDADALERNATLMRLPCPLWDRAEAYAMLKDSVESVDAVDGEWDALFLTAKDLAEAENDGLVQAWLRKIKGDEVPETMPLAEAVASPLDAAIAKMEEGFKAPATEKELSQDMPEVTQKMCDDLQAEKVGAYDDNPQTSPAKDYRSDMEFDFTLVRGV